ncbi:hypothetical protein GOV13_05010 [Candidatus Pacearchaeota archaeon]|nr:hypothetical protein [Candidatus Pacearchaeota archaeon]
MKSDLKDLSYEERRAEGERFKKEFLEFQENIRGRCKILFKGEMFSPAPHMISLRAENLDQGYYKTIAATLEHGAVNYIDSGSYEGSNRVELDHTNLVFTEQRDKSKDVNSIRSLVPWTRGGLTPPTDEDTIQKYFNNYLIGEGMGDNEHYRYSSWIVGMGDYSITPLEMELLSKELITDTKEKARIEKGVKLYSKDVPRGTKLNQLDWCAEHFVEKGFGTNHCYITVGCAEGLQRYDWPSKTDTDKGSTECLRGLSFKIRDENKLNMTCFFRSWDLYSGLPTNLGGLTLLNEYLANLVNVKSIEKEKDLPMLEPGILVANSDGLHIYQDRFESARDWVGVL